MTNVLYMWKSKGGFGVSFPILQEKIKQSSPLYLSHLAFRLIMAAKSKKNEPWRKAQAYVKWQAFSLKCAEFPSTSHLTAAAWEEPGSE